MKRCLDLMRLGRVLDLTDAAMATMAREFGATFWPQDLDCLGLDGVRYCAKA